MKNRIMVDLETLGTAPGSVILSIGAVRFDVEEGLLDEFYVNIDVESSQRLGLTIDGATVMWWMKQSDAARAKLSEGSGEDVGVALGKFLACGPTRTLRSTSCGATEPTSTMCSWRASVGSCRRILATQVRGAVFARACTVRTDATAP